MILPRDCATEPLIEFGRFGVSGCSWKLPQSFWQLSRGWPLTSVSFAQWHGALVHGLMAYPHI